MSHQEHFFPERMPAVFTSSKSTVTEFKWIINITRGPQLSLFEVDVCFMGADSFWYMYDNPAIDLFLVSLKLCE